MGDNALCLVGPCRDWTASAVMDWGLSVSWVPGIRDDLVTTAKVNGRVKAGIATLARSGWLPADGLGSLAESWICVQNVPGWGGRAFQKRAAESLSVVPGVRFVSLPAGAWVMKAAKANIHTRESLAELLVALGYPVSLDKLKGRAG